MGDKAEIRFPEFESERVSFTNPEKKNKLKEIFHPANRDHLHYCGHCEDDFTGEETHLIVKPKSKSPIPCPNRPQILNLGSDQV